MVILLVFSIFLILPKLVFDIGIGLGRLVSSKSFVQIILALTFPWVVGSLIPRLLKSRRVKRFFKSREKYIPGFLLFFFKMIPKDLDENDLRDKLLRKPEVEWEAEGFGRNRVGLLMRSVDPLKRPGWMRVLEAGVGVPGIGTCRTIHRDQLIFTGRTGEDLLPELLSLGLNIEDLGDEVMDELMAEFNRQRDA